MIDGKLKGTQYVCIHPMQCDDIKRDKDSRRRYIVLSRLNQYSQIENPPVLTDADIVNGSSI